MHSEALRELLLLFKQVTLFGPYQIDYPEMKAWRERWPNVPDELWRC